MMNARWTKAALVAAGMAGVVLGRADTAVGDASPLAVIEKQLRRANLLIVLDNTTSMVYAPVTRGPNAGAQGEMGPNCLDGVACREWGAAGTCYFAGGACTTTADCFRCSNDNTKLCTTDSDCPGGICPTGWKDVEMCMPAGSVATPGRICSKSGYKCRVDSDCPTLSGISDDICIPGSSRFALAKRGIKNFASAYHKMANLGLMTFYSNGHYAYYPPDPLGTPGTVTDYVSKEQLVSFGCYSSSTGPSSTCNLHGGAFTWSHVSSQAQYDVQTSLGVKTVWAPYCGEFCAISGEGTGRYRGSNYSYTSATAAPTYAAGTVIKPAAFTFSTYQGRMIQSGGNTYVYWNPGNLWGAPATPGNPYNDIFCGGSCRTTCGGWWSPQLTPFLPTTDSATDAFSSAVAISARMNRVDMGGISWTGGGTPSGCLFKNEPLAAQTPQYSVYHYMQAVKTGNSTLALPADPNDSCRTNAVVYVTDGLQGSFGDTECGLADCDGVTDPTYAACTCKTLHAARALYRDLGVKTYFLAYGATAADPMLKNVAKAAGNTPFFPMASEAQLSQALAQVIAAVAGGEYATAPSTTSAATLNGDNVVLGNLILDARTDYPSWRGRLYAYEPPSTTPRWEAYETSFNPNRTMTVGVDFWKSRNVWTSNGNKMVKIIWDTSNDTVAAKEYTPQTSGTWTTADKDAAYLATLGFGASADEAVRVARWFLGDPNVTNQAWAPNPLAGPNDNPPSNPAVLGAMVNSTPIDVGPPPASRLPGGPEFYTAHLGRPFLTYVGSSDGMVHAFFTKDHGSYVGGKEAFAYIPQDKIAHTVKLYTQGGQLPSPSDHLYGLASSPKVKTLCVSECDDDGNGADAVWKTVLLMTEGYGGNDAFMLDITNPFTSSSTVKTDVPPVSLMWHTQHHLPAGTSADVTTYNERLGLTTAVPAFYFAKDGNLDGYRIAFGSSYGDGTHSNQGRVFLSASAKTGAAGATTHTATPSSCTQKFGLLADVATAIDYGTGQQSRILAAYFADTHGTLKRFVPTRDSNGYTLDSGTYSTVGSWGCDQPLYFSPAIVQLDRYDNSKHPGEVYIVQATNSALDPVTRDSSAKSRIIIRKDVATTGIVTAGTFGGAAEKVLEIGQNEDFCESLAPCVKIPDAARPMSTPNIILKENGEGFLMVSIWWLPPTSFCSPTGTSYVNIHEVNADGTITQLYAQKIENKKPVTNAMAIGSSFVVTVDNSILDLTSTLPSTVKFKAAYTSATTTVPPPRFRALGWSECFGTAGTDMCM